MQAMPGITSQLRRSGNARLTNACLMSVLSVYLQILIIRTQNRYSPGKLCADIAVSIQVCLNATHPLPCLHWNTSHGENITYQLKILQIAASGGGGVVVVNVSTT